MRSLKSLTTAVFALFTLLFLSSATPAHAQFPAYLHAISDLRTARAYLEQDTRPQFEGHRHHAIEEINHALDEMKKAAIDDGKTPWHTPPPQSGGNAALPVHSAIKLLKEARGDVDHGHDRPENQGLRERSLGHVDAAIAELEATL
jgi:hypothetical protein